MHCSPDADADAGMDDNNKGHAPAMQRSNDSHASARQRSHDSHASTADISPPDGAFGDTSSVTSSGVYVKRSVSLLGATAMVIGSIVGSGIFISPKGVLEGSGSVGLTLIIWVACGIISLMGALCYIELSTMLPKFGGDFVYIGEAFGRVPAFVAAWTIVIVLKPSGAAVIALTCAEYVVTPLFDDGCGTAPVLQTKLIAVLVVLLLSGVNCYSATLASKVNILFVVAKLGSLLLITVCGIIRLFQGYTEALETGFQNTETNVGVIALGVYSGMWAYSGWVNLNYISEEVVNPNRNLPLAVILGLPVVTVGYLLTNISYFTVMSAEELLESPAVAITWGDEVLQSARHIIPIAVAFSTFGAINSSMFSTSRVIFAVAREGQMVNSLSMVHSTKYTPTPAILLNTMMTLLFIIPSNIENLITFASFSEWLKIFFTTVGLIIMRRTRKDLERPFKVPLVLPIIVAMVSLYLVIAPIQDEPQIEFFFALLFMFAGLLLYYPFVHRKLVLPGTAAFEVFTQLFLEVVPESDS